MFSFGGCQAAQPTGTESAPFAAGRPKSLPPGSAAQPTGTESAPAR
jgi:hypothetical protein